IEGSFLVVGDSIASLARAPIPPDERAHLHATLELTFANASLNASLIVDGVPPVTVSSAMTAPWPEAPAISLHLTALATGPGQIVYVERASLTRQRLIRCGAVEPPFGIVDDGVTEIANVALTSLVRGDGRTLCGVM